MSAPVVKICGVRDAHHACVAAEAGADMVGLVFAQSRRRVTPSEARVVAMSLAQTADTRPRLVGVFVNEAIDVIEHVAREALLDRVQLSGDEAPEACARLTLPYYKVVHLRPGMTADDALHIANKYPGAAAIVLDAAGSTPATAWGGSGMMVDWTVAADVARRADQPVMLAGGLRPDTVAHAVVAVRPWGVDVSSGVESDGVKDDTKIQAFVARAKEQR